MSNRLFNSLHEDVFSYPKMGEKVLDYDAYWQDRGKGKIRDRFKIMADYIEKGSTVCDIGCGDGLCLKHLSDMKSIKASGIDISQNAVMLAREELPDSTFKVANIIDEPEAVIESDYIILSEVIEHVSNPEQLIEAVKDKYKKALLITIPNFGFYRYRLRCLFGRFPVQWVHHPSEHLRFWSIPDFKWWLSEMGLKVEHVVPTNGLNLLSLYKSKLLMNITSWQVLFVIKA